MVIGAEIYPPSGQKHQGYAHVEEYYQNPQKGYAHIEEDYYEKDDCYNSSSSRVNVKANPYMTSPQPIRHGLVGQEGYAYQDNYYGGQAQKHNFQDIHGTNFGEQGYPTSNYGGQAQKHKFQDIHGTNFGEQGYPTSNYGGKQHSNYGMNFGEQGYPTSNYGREGHAKGKQMNGMHHNNGSYETEHESYTHMGPNRYESASYDYANYGQKNKKNWAAAGAEWIAKGL